MRILLVEDDDRVVAALQPALKRANLAVDRAATAAEAMAKHQDADLILLDMGLPDQDGYAVCQQIRALNPVPIIAVTARREEASVVAALRAGVDDYVTKPYRLAELMARIEAVMRRYGRHTVAEAAEYGGIRVDTGSRQAYVDGEPSRAGEGGGARPAGDAGPGGRRRGDPGVDHGGDLGDQVGRRLRTINVHVASLRAKLGGPSSIETVRGTGYRLAQA